MTKIESNKLIVEFLEGEVAIGYESPTCIDYTVTGKCVEQWRSKGLFVGGIKDKMMLENCKFHSQWEWLMMVVEKIKDIDNQADEELAEAFAKSEHLEIFSTSIFCPLEAVYERALQFITWWNNYVKI